MARVYGDRWEVVRQLREGGQSHTFLVKDKTATVTEVCVLKRLKNIRRLDRFKREIETVRGLSHDGILRIVDFDLESDPPFLVTEYCTGGSLEEAERYWTGRPAKALDIFQEICKAVAFAHNQGVIHRDLKPANIFLRTSAGPAVVGDFGLCFVQDDAERLTKTTEAVGARQFMAPELEDGRLDNVTTACDVYSLGKILYWLMSGGKIFSREKHRHPEWDLMGRNLDTDLGWNNVYMEHINRILDLMIVADQRERRDVDNIAILTKKAAGLIEEKFTPISNDLKQPCRYCGTGHYRVLAKSHTELRNFGLNSVGTNDFRVLACTQCGHVQMFRVDIAARKDWWRNS